MSSTLRRLCVLTLLQSAVLAAPLAAVAAVPQTAKLTAGAEKDAYYVYAVKHFGRPTACRVHDVHTFDGETFGTVECRFKNGAVFEEETSPPEVYRVSLRLERGLPDAAGIRRFVEQDAKSRGFAVDYKHADRSTAAQGESTVTYWDPDSGLNAAVGFTYRAGKLVEVAAHAAP